MEMLSLFIVGFAVNYINIIVNLYSSFNNRTEYYCVFYLIFYLIRPLTHSTWLVRWLINQEHQTIWLAIKKLLYINLILIRIFSLCIRNSVVPSTTSETKVQQGHDLTYNWRAGSGTWYWGRI